MKHLSKITLFLLCFPIMVIGNNDKIKGKYTKEKKVSKEFNVNSDASLQVINSYGNIDIVTWNQNKTTIEVTIKTNSDSEEMAQKKLDEISIDFTGSSSRVTARTIFGDKDSKSWKFWDDGKKKHVSAEVHYKIKLPVNNSIDLNNDYGSIIINDLNGNAKINCDYGQLIIGSLNAENNSLNFDYTSKSSIGYMKSGKINADYSGFSLGKAERLDLSADYTDSSIGTIDNLVYNCDYGKVTVENAGDVVGRGDYLNQDFTTVKGKLDLRTDYGSIKVRELTESAKSVNIEASYTGISLGYNSNYNFRFIVNTSYASLDGTKDLNVSKTDKDYTKKSYEGYYGSSNSNNMINIRSNYGGVSLIKR